MKRLRTSIPVCLLFMLPFGIVTAQNVGIGTTAPMQTLDVNGRLRVADGVIQNGSAPVTNTVDLGLYSQVPNFWMRFVTNNGRMQFFTDNGNGGSGSVPKMVLTENGNLGIGSDNPAGKLHIKTDGETGIEALDQQQLLTAGAFLSFAEWQTFTAGKSGLLKSIALKISGSDSVTIKISARTVGTTFVLLSTTKMKFSESKDIGDEFKFFTLAQPPLVTAGATYKIDFSFSANNKGIVLVKKGDENKTPYQGGYCSFYQDKVNGFDEQLWDFAFKTYVTPYSNVDVVVNQGNLGIGTPSPSARLDLNGSFKMTDGSQGAGKILTSDATGLASWANAATQIGVGSAAGNTPYWDGSAWVTNSSNIYNNGTNVGIGTAAPTYKLQISSNTASGLRIDVLTAGTDALSIGGKGKFSVDAPNNAGGRFLIKEDGRVGIGTPTPKDLLDVAGKMSATGFMCRKGISGDNTSINYYNFFWKGNGLECWVDDVYVGLVSGLSDSRLKNNIAPMQNTALAKLMQLKPVTFNYKNIPGTVFTGSPVLQDGFLADELQQIIPSAVNGDKDAVNQVGKIQPQNVNPLPIVAILTKSVQEQQQQIDELKKQNALLLQRLEELVKR